MLHSKNEYIRSKRKLSCSLKCMMFVNSFFNERSLTSIVLCGVLFSLLRVCFPNIAAAPCTVYSSYGVTYVTLCTVHVWIKIHVKINHSIVLQRISIVILSPLRLGLLFLPSPAVKKATWAQVRYTSGLTLIMQSHYPLCVSKHKVAECYWLEDLSLTFVGHASHTHYTETKRKAEVTLTSSP